MATYRKGKDGKFTGSIAGAANVPTASTRRATPVAPAAPENPSSSTSDVYQRFLATDREVVKTDDNYLTGRSGRRYGLCEGDYEIGPTDEQMADPEFVEAAARCDRAYLRRAAARSPLTDEAALMRLAADRDPWVRMQVLEHPHATGAVVDAVARNSTWCNALDEVEDFDGNRVKGDDDGYLMLRSAGWVSGDQQTPGEAALNHPKCPTSTLVAKDRFGWLWGRSDVDPAYLESLASSDDPSRRIAALVNSGTPDATRWRIVAAEGEGRDAIRYAAFKGPNIPEDIRAVEALRGLPVTTWRLLGYLKGAGWPADDLPPRPPRR